MSIPDNVRQILDSRGLNFEVLTYSEKQPLAQAAQALGIALGKIAVATPVHDAQGVALAIYPADHRLDLAAFNGGSQRSLAVIPSAQVHEKIPRSIKARCVPIAELYGCEALVHKHLVNLDIVYFVASPGTLVALSGWEFNLMQGPACYDEMFAKMRTDSGVCADPNAARDQRAVRIQERLQNVSDLPPMPGVAYELLQLSVNPYANATDLAAIVEQDPSLSAQLIRYANSPFYNYRGDVEGVRDAISRVLGFDMVMDITLGISVGRSLSIPRDGPLGLESHWRQCIYAAVLVQRLGGMLSSSNRPRPGMAYLAGLLHNFGVLVLGQLFPDDFALLREAVRRQPDEPLNRLELELLGVTHQQAGAWLMEAWGMPDEVIVAIREHHNAGYHGRLSIYPSLVLIANCLLKTLNIGDQPAGELPTEVLWALGLSEEDVLYAFENVMQNRNGLDFMALQMVA